jgi:Domain of unknown function (DUF6378)
MTVRKRERIEDLDFNETTEQIPPHLAEELDVSRPPSFATFPEPVIDDEQEASAIYAEGTEAPDESAEYRLYILGKAAHIVTRDRNVEYGPPEKSFDKIAAMWGAYLGTDMLMAHDVAAMLALLKIARISTNPLHEDSWVDLAGYAACGADVTNDLRNNPNLQEG